MFRSVQQRLILRDSLLTRQAGSVLNLKSLSRDAVLLILSTNNTQERLEGEITCCWPHTLRETVEVDPKLSVKI